MLGSLRPRDRGGAGRRRACRGGAALLGLALAATPLRTRANEPPPPRPIALQWDAPDGCPSRERFLDAVQRLSGPIRASQDGVRISVSLRRDADAFSLELELSEPAPQRRALRDADCNTLVAAAAVVVGVALDPIAFVSSATTGIEDEVASVEPSVVLVPPPIPMVPTITTTPAASAPRDPKPPPRPAGRPTRLRFVSGAGAGLGYGLSPRATAVIHGEFGLAWPTIRVGVVGIHAFASTRALRDGVGIRARTTAGGVHVAWRPITRVVALELGTGLLVGATSGGGVGPGVRGRMVTATTIAWSAGVDLAWPPRSRIAVFLQAQALIGLLRPRIGLRDASGLHEVFRVQPVGALAFVGPRLRLP